jgi:hypothetical protein
MLNANMNSTVIFPTYCHLAMRAPAIRCTSRYDLTLWRPNAPGINYSNHVDTNEPTRLRT